MFRVVLAGLAAAAAVAGCATTSSTEVAGAPAAAFGATVVRVVDGDTFIARRDGRELRVRLIGVDAPESVTPGVPVECYGPAASRLLHALLPVGTRVRAAHEPGGERDRFGRELWDVWLPDGRFLQGVLVARGAADARVYQPQHEYADTLARLEDRARSAGLGRWGRCGR